MNEESKDAVSFLEDAAYAINQRASDRDVEKERSMEAIVRAFNAVTGHSLTTTEGWAFMVLLKVKRASMPGFRPDDFVDMAAYSALMGESRSEEDTP